MRIRDLINAGAWLSRQGRGAGGYLRDLLRFRRLSRTARGDRFPPLRVSDLYPCVGDKTETTTFDRHYVFHTAWAARTLATIAPERHVDISSSLYFASLVSAFIPIDFYDYSPPTLALSNLRTLRADLHCLPFPDGSIQSLSCMHVIEHVGLGRYGDSLDPDGDLRAMSELARVTAERGNLLIVVPVGRRRIEFNAHRVYSYEQVVNSFPGFSLRDFSLIPDSPGRGGLLTGATPEQANAQSFGCGCFWFVKRSAR